MSLRRALLLALMTIGGCSYHHETKEEVPTRTYRAPDYRSPASVGRLRRLAILPAKYQPNKGAEREPSFNLEKAKESFEEIVASYLIEQKGYEVILVREVISDWRKKYPLLSENESKPKDLQSLAIDLGKRLEIDGIVVLQGIDPKMWDSPHHAFLNIMLLNGPLFYNISAPNAKAWIFDTVRGELAWSHEHSTFADNDGAPVTKYNFEDLFRNLDNAVPAYLIEE